MDRTCPTLIIHLITLKLYRLGQKISVVISLNPTFVSMLAFQLVTLMLERIMLPQR